MHLGVIPDGNRRWAKERNSTLGQAYAIGFCTVVDLTLRMARLGGHELTFFGLSNDNYSKRSRQQLDYLFWQITDSMQVASLLLKDRGVRIRFFGALDDLSSQHHNQLLAIERRTSRLSKLALRLNILVNYSVEWDIRNYSNARGTRDIPACDVVFRSGRAHRLSGFLPIQSANAELHFSSSLWPDVQSKDVLRCLSHFATARRSFGA
jgi:undecaprenyl diphosphate synthase